MKSKLTGEANEFFKANASLAKANGTLVPETESAFLLLCQLWARYTNAETEGRDDIKIVALSKQVQNLMKSFGMLPDSRKRMGLERKTSLSELLAKRMGDADKA